MNENFIKYGETNTMCQRIDMKSPLHGINFLWFFGFSKIKHIPLKVMNEKYIYMERQIFQIIDLSADLSRTFRD